MFISLLRTAMAVVLCAVLAACGLKGDRQGTVTSVRFSTTGVGATSSFPYSSTSAGTAPSPIRLRAKVLGKLSHRTTDFTQGLVFAGPSLIQTTGRRGQSKLQELDPDTGEVRREVDLPQEVFGEGVAAVGDRLLVLTWQEQQVLVYDMATFELRHRVPMSGEGWGLCFDGTWLWQSDGTSTLRRRDPTTLAETGSVTITSGGHPLTAINELECSEGAVYANVWMRDHIVRIDPSSGAVAAIIDASNLLQERPTDPDAVLNGIARHQDGTWLLTGKLWPAMFKVDFEPVG